METPKEKEQVTMRTPFPPHQISKLPKPTKAQTDEVKADFKKGIRCDICGAWHHPNVVHLDYVGHAALTDRMLDVDPLWSWEPLALDAEGLPAWDGIGGLWIKLTVSGVTRLGYGNAGDKKGGDAVKEIIGDALRNAAMRFGAALDLWHKGNLHTEGDDDPGAQAKPKTPPVAPKAEATKAKPSPAAIRTAAEAKIAKTLAHAKELALKDMPTMATLQKYDDATFYQTCKGIQAAVAFAEGSKEFDQGVSDLDIPA
jgi:hypothetical protein